MEELVLVAESRCTSHPYYKFLEQLPFLFESIRVVDLCIE